MFSLIPSSLKLDLAHKNWSRITPVLIICVNAVFDIFRVEKVLCTVAPLEICSEREEAPTPTTHFHITLEWRMFVSA